jgi:hypothetical protein
VHHLGSEDWQGEQCDMPIALIRLSLGGMLIKKYLIPTSNSGVKFHVTKLLDELFMPPVLAD